MKKLIVLCAVALTVLLVVAPVVGCQQQPQPTPAPAPSPAIMVESNIVEAGSSFMVSVSNLNPQQKIWVEWEYRTNDGAVVAGGTYYGEPDEDGSIHPIIEVPENTIPGDYRVEIYIGKHFENRELIAALPIHIQAREE